MSIQAKQGLTEYITSKEKVDPTVASSLGRIRDSFQQWCRKKKIDGLPIASLVALNFVWHLFVGAEGWTHHQREKVIKSLERIRRTSNRPFRNACHADHVYKKMFVHGIMELPGAPAILDASPDLLKR